MNSLAPAIAPFRRFGFPLAVLACLWVGVGVAGYGLALTHLGPGWTTPFAYNGEIRGGTISDSSRPSLFDSAYRFKAGGFPLEFYLPTSFLGSEGMPDFFGDGGRADVRSSFDGLVFEMTLVKDGQSTTVLGPQDVARKHSAWLAETMRTGKACVFLGLFLALSPLLFRIFLSRRQRLA